MSKQVKIRFNTNFGKSSDFEWRLLIDGVEQLVNHIEIESPSKTTSEFIEGHGIKHHITTEANEVSVVSIQNKIIAYIK